MPASAAALQDGWKVVEVARRVLVCRQNVHNWIARYQQGGLTAEPRRIERQLARAGWVPFRRARASTGASSATG
jgi:transposase-like protein